ncbi:hypothetical protein BKP45_04960 [Anaerobacillus alkalidiazotrophicus]|uniref:Uncharacterized protein n=1 Tax=Anaerobacillus alkalidiazotrophicus TaxID=472963 RepID=A0A1S2MBS1_9BACI|nr:hypothetical protein [Anaerobacillus alkalidiazotrophicus]OIJ22030.1 hypothetical protein BKP45_04960 [Anaerobacillus alkalidiazotrophicus]
MSDKLDLILQKLEALETGQNLLKTEINKRFDDLKNTIETQHIENLNSDNFILKSLDDVKESVRFVNHRVADAELELNNIKKVRQ